MYCAVCFCLKRMTAYEMRMSDWSSDVCSSDLHQPQILSGARRSKRPVLRERRVARPARRRRATGHDAEEQEDAAERQHPERKGVDPREGHVRDRKSVVSGESVHVRLEPGCRRILNNKERNHG